MADTTVPSRPSVESTAMTVIIAVSVCHFINDIMQSLLSALYPMLKEDYRLDFWQIGLLTFAFQVTASLLQPIIGMATDKKPMPYSLPVGMAFSATGLLVLGFAQTYWLLLLGAMLIGTGSAIFHPESSRVARLASGGRFGMAQSIFQLGGNFGQALGPLLAAFIVVPRGQVSVAYFTIAACIGMLILWQVGGWYSRYQVRAAGRGAPKRAFDIPRHRVGLALAVLALLVLTKNTYTASISSYYTFYTIERFGVGVQESQVLLFVFLGAQAVGLVLGGLFGDRFGPKAVIWFSILGVLPFTLAMPYANFFWTIVLSIVIGLILSSAFSAIVVFAQELLPGRVGLVAGIFFGLAFGMGGIAAALLGVLADSHGIVFVYKICSYLPLLGLLTILLPSRLPLNRV